MGRPKDQGLHLKFAAARSIARALGLKAVDRPSLVLREVRDTIAIYRHIAEFDRASPSAAVHLAGASMRPRHRCLAMRPSCDDLGGDPPPIRPVPVTSGSFKEAEARAPRSFLL